MVTAGWHHDGSRPTEVINVVDNNTECDNLDRYEHVNVGVSKDPDFVSRNKFFFTSLTKNAY